MANDELGEEYDEFRTSTGLKDDYDGVITDAFFGQAQGSDRMVLFAKVSADDGDEPEIRWGIGTGWVSYDGGKTVEHPTERYFNNRSGWAKAFTAMMEAGAKEELGKRSKGLERRGPKDSRLIIGLKFHFMVKTEVQNMPKRGADGQPERDARGQVIRETVEFPTVLPTQYLGTAEDQPASTGKSRGGRRASSASTSSDASAAGTAQTAGSTAASSNGDVDPNLMTKVKVLARTKTYNEWVDAVLDLPGALEDSALTSRMNEEFYAELKG